MSNKIYRGTFSAGAIRGKRPYDLIGEWKWRKFKLSLDYSYRDNRVYLVLAKGNCKSQMEVVEEALYGMPYEYIESILEGVASKVNEKLGSEITQDMARRVSEKMKAEIAEDMARKAGDIWIDTTATKTYSTESTWIANVKPKKKDFFEKLQDDVEDWLKPARKLISQ